MSRQEARRRLHEADPNLNIISGGHRHPGSKDESNWDKAAGVICSSCGREVFRARDGLCMPCWEKEHEIEVRDQTGISNWLPMNIIHQITHPARKEEAQEPD